MVKQSSGGRIYFALLGIVTTAFGLADLLVTASGSEFAYRGFLEIPGDIFRGGWGGIIVLFAGLFYLSGIRNFDDIHQFAKVVMGSILIWVVAGCDIFAMITESIPSWNEETGPWFNTLPDFIAAYAPPYAPSVLLLPFSLVVIYYIRKRASGEEGSGNSS
ncbi:MAG TPA: hypothetical protein ENF23_03220 [Methanosarcinales archaeon]|nr:MAG: hypothetical protein DRO03_10440 [Methanosarcinales archaeon]HDN65296.1 hypothetical protein [Methanosarcinales archaeon]